MSDFFVILVFGVSAAWIAKRFGQPVAVAQVFVGLVIGPSVLNWIEPGELLQLIGKLGVTLLLGIAGLQLGLMHLLKEGWTGFWVALLGMAICLAGGYGFALWLGSPHSEAIYVGTTLTATSIGISVQVLHQVGLINNKIGRVVVAAAVIDDVLALFLLAIAHGALVEGTVASQLALSIFLVIILLTMIFMLSRWLAKGFIQQLLHNHLFVGISVTIVVVFLFGWVTEAAGYSLVVGGFFAGLGLGDGFNQLQRENTVIQLEKVVLLMIPFFFIAVGSKAQWEILADPGVPVLVIGLLVIALLGKIGGGFLATWRGNGFLIPLLIGTSMAPRGEVAFIIAGLGYAQGHISHHVLVALILMTIGAALLAPLLMTSLARSVTT